MSKFIGRKQEIKMLEGFLDKPSASLIVIRGRRRIGKSRLLKEFGKRFESIFTFSGLPPSKNKKITAKKQRQEFAKQLIHQGYSAGLKTNDWSDLFWHLSEQTKSGRILIILDEISWMGSKDPNFLGKLKNAWDLHFSNNEQLILAICGSASAWIEKNILSSSGFLGRESLSFILEELSLHECLDFWGNEIDRVSPYEKLKILAVTGGVPRYLEHINPKLSAEDNIYQLCFQKSGILFGEFEKIFADLFYPKNILYKKILSPLAESIADQATIASRLGAEQGGTLSGYLDDLIQSGFISRDFTWILKNETESNLSHYRLKDNYSRFYLKYIEPNKKKIEAGNLKNISLANFKGWNTLMGLQVENLILSNRDLIKTALGIDPNDIVSDNPFFQKKSARQPGCQIDYLIQTKFNTLFICEIKYTRDPVGMTVVDEVKEKIKRLAMPRHFSYRPVLIHVNGVAEAVEDSQFFSYIIDFSKFIQS